METVGIQLLNAEQNNAETQGTRAAGKTALTSSRLRPLSSLQRPHTARLALSPPTRIRGGRNQDLPDHAASVGKKDSRDFPMGHGHSIQTCSECVANIVVFHPRDVCQAGRAKSLDFWSIYLGTPNFRRYTEDENHHHIPTRGLRRTVFLALKILYFSSLHLE